MASALPQPVECCQTACCSAETVITSNGTLSGVGDPNGVVTATAGTIYVNTDTAQMWVCTGGSVWV